MHTSPLTAQSSIVVHVNQGEVTLEGTALSPLARREATRLAETVLGVKGIRNRLSVVNAQTAEIPPER
jgi:osmotically-inducible protein OsmY